MNKYKVTIQEVHTMEIEVEAKNKDEAREIANTKISEGDIRNLEYSHTFDKDEWIVNRV